MTGPPAPVIPKSSAVQNVVPWVGRNVRPIGIGIAALLAVSLAYGFIQKMRSPSATKPSLGKFSHTAARRTRVGTRQRCRACSGRCDKQCRTRQDKINADRLLAERTAREQKAADEAKLAAQKAADDAKLLAEQQKVNQPDQTKLVPGLETAANTKTQEAPKTHGTQKQTQQKTRSLPDATGQAPTPNPQTVRRRSPRDPPSPRATTGQQLATVPSPSLAQPPRAVSRRNWIAVSIGCKVRGSSSQSLGKRKRLYF